MAHDKYCRTIEGVEAEIDQYTGKDARLEPTIWHGKVELRRAPIDRLIGRPLDKEHLAPQSLPCEIGPSIRMANGLEVIIHYTAQYRVPIVGFPGEADVRRYLKAAKKCSSDVDNFLKEVISQVSVRKKGFRELFDPALSKGWICKTTPDGRARKLIMVALDEAPYLGLMLAKESKDGWLEGWQVKITKY